MLHQWPQRQFTLSLIQPVSPLAQRVICRAVFLRDLSQRNHLEVRWRCRNHSQTRGQPRTEIAFGYLLAKSQQGAGVNVVPKHIERTVHGIQIGIALRILLVVKLLQFQHVAVYPSTLLRETDGVV